MFMLEETLFIEVFFTVSVLGLVAYLVIFFMVLKYIVFFLQRRSKTKDRISSEH